ncbi:hypothetical protein CBR_g29395 [Chara braunii]|uniref:Protein kinase domain-containing protein n=1 Tax=Chara braunii TaxID=69332 RepID=A0A388JWN7_CHABU|nr:hypothetical protein CBR_g29395 [Chara braunii]|eukprot:GBG62195.1 hypothetical protein CBR_g29395 [Chara braunii]
MALHDVSLTRKIMQVEEWSRGVAVDSFQGMPFHSTYQPSNRRKMRVQAGVELVNTRILLGNVSDILADSDSHSEGYRHEIRGVDVAADTNTVYYVERACPENTTGGVCSSSVKSAAPLESGGFNISNIIAPETVNGSELYGVVVLEDKTSLSLLIADNDNSLFWKMNLTSGQLQNRTLKVYRSENNSTLSPVRFALRPDPKRPTFFVASRYRIIIIEGHDDPFQAPSDSVRRLAGPIDSTPTPGYVNSDAPQDVRFKSPIIGPRSYSKCGSSLYVADTDNNVVRKINTKTGATTTIAGIQNSTVPSSVDGPPQNATLYGPTALALTTDCCNLFVAEAAPDGKNGGAIRWLPLRHKDGEVLNVTTVAFINASSPLNFTALTLSQYDNFMYAGTNGSNIFRLVLNKSLLHQCPKAPEKNYWVIILTVTLTSGTFIAIVLAVLFYRRRLCECHKGGQQQGQESQLGVPLPQAKGPATLKKSVNPEDNADIDSWSWGEASDSVSFDEMNTAEDLARVVDKYDIRLDGTREFSLAKLMEATNNFGGQHLLNGVRGGYGDMYRASLRVGARQKDVAIKRMRGELTEMKYSQFRAEVIMLSRLRHENVCRLIGYCKEGGHGILIYKFVTGGSLHDRLHGRAGRSVLSNKSQLREDESQSRWSKSQTITDAASSTCDNPSFSSVAEAGGELNTENTAKTEFCWGERLSVALQVATGLRYLHHEVKPRVVHRDIKCHNVLIERTEGSRRMRAIIIDFGLAKLDASYVPESDLTCGDEEGMTVRTLARTGTPGYMAPEYACHREVTPKSDVYGFGVVLLELVTGRKAVEKVISADGRDVGAVNLVQWSRKWLSAKKPVDSDVNHIDRLATGFFDPRLVSGLTPTEKVTMHDVAQLGYRCTMDDATKRPKMKKIVLMLDGIKKKLKQDPDALSTLPEEGERSGSSSDDCHSGTIVSNGNNMMGGFAPEKVSESYAKEYEARTDKTSLYSSRSLFSS